MLHVSDMKINHKMLINDKIHSFVLFKIKKKMLFLHVFFVFILKPQKRKKINKKIKKVK